jgi:hypothetical protein
LETLPLVEDPGPENPSKDVFINEVLPLATGPIPSAYIELVNHADENVDLDGWTLRDDAGVVIHTFAAQTLQPGHAATLIWGDITPDSGTIIEANGSPLTAGTEMLSLERDDGEEVDLAEWENNTSGTSLNRQIDGDPTTWLVSHDDVEGSNSSASPGKRANGDSWGTE